MIQLYPTVMVTSIFVVVLLSLADHVAVAQYAACDITDEACERSVSRTLAEGIDDALDDAALLQTGRHVEIQRQSSGGLASSLKAKSGTEKNLADHEACTGNYLLDLLAYDSRFSLLHHPEIIDAAANISLPSRCGMGHSKRIGIQTEAFIRKASRQSLTAAHENDHAMSWTALAIYCAGMAVVFIYLMRTIAFPRSDSKQLLEEASKGCPEKASWDNSYIGWLGIGWCDLWMAHWGTALSPSETKIEPNALGVHGWPEDQARESSDDFGAIWEAQIAKPGPDRGVGDLVTVIIQFATWPRIIIMFFCVVVYQFVMFVGPALCVKDILAMLVQSHREEAAQTATWRFAPTMKILCLYAGATIFMIVAETLQFLLMTRANTKLRSGLTAYCFKKAQRLPGSDGNFTLPPMAGQPESSQYSFVALMDNDINTNLQQMFVSLFNIITTVPIFIVLVWMLVKQIGKATLAMIGIQVVLIGLIVVSVIGQTMSQKVGQDAAGQRITLTQEILQGIRIIKSYAWEEPELQLINEQRQKELKCIHAFYRWLGMFVWLGLMYGRILCLGTLCFTALFYGYVSSVQIFVFLQLMRSFTGVMGVLMGSMPLLLGVIPSLQRINVFLRLPESSRDAQIVAATAPDAPSSAMRLKAQPSQGSGSVVAMLKGSFTWREDQPATLHDIDFEVRAGELVGVVGEVGAGKTAFLTALLGEICPCEGAVMDMPPVIGYHAQVPLIVEGNLRENVFFWREENEERYQSVLYGACLLRDLEYLPGGDLCSIGHRGIALSGGQKARVSLARLGYTTNTDLMLIDDPFSSVDMPTGNHICMHLLKGELLQNKARVVVTQPDMARLQHFDRVVVIREGRIVSQGSPSEVEKSEAFRALLKNGDADEEALSLAPNPTHVTTAETHTEERKTIVPKLREDENEGRADYDTIKYFFDIGGSWNMGLCFGIYGLFNLFGLVFDMVVAQWANNTYLPKAQQLPIQVWTLTLTFWLGVCGVTYIVVWIFGQTFTLRISDAILDRVMPTLLNARVDGFFDKQPNGRILNRLSADLYTVDYLLFARITQTLGLIWQFFVPVGYVHAMLPWFFTVATVPFYFLIFYMLRRYWNLMVPLRYVSMTTRSKMMAYLDESGIARTTIRAYGVGNQVKKVQCEAVDDFIKTDFATLVSKRWMTSRVMLLYSSFLTAVTLLSLWCPWLITVSNASLCINYIIGILMSVDGNLDMASAAQFQFISMNRIHEYTDTSNVPQEKAQVRASDTPFKSCFLKLNRSVLGKLQLVKTDRFKIMRDGNVVLEESPDGQSFVLASGATWSDLCTTSVPQFADFDVDKLKLKSGGGANGLSQLQDIGHRLVGLDSSYGGSPRNDDAESKLTGMAQGLCYAQEITLHIQSNWLSDGARVTVRGLSAGYAGYENTLHGVNMDIEPRSKVAIMGSTGCGKSTFMLCLLRLLEPRSGPGSIMVNGVDITQLGLKTLRQAFGIVPQDPIIFNGTLRTNLDPFGEHSDERLWRALCAVELGSDVYRLVVPGSPRDCPDIAADSLIEPGSVKDQCLSCPIKSDGENLSFGQRQLLCIARMILRQPSILLLDECTSAVDPRTQDLVQSSIRKEFATSTLISIAHRLETIMDFDKVVVMDKGRAVKTGNPTKFSSVKELVAWAKGEL
jgi:ABC-type multidrug transport system fused ATPase/permease subunit